MSPAAVAPAGPFLLLLRALQPKMCEWRCRTDRAWKGHWRPGGTPLLGFDLPLAIVSEGQGMSAAF